MIKMKVVQNLTILWNAPSIDTLHNKVVKRVPYKNYDLYTDFIPQIGEMIRVPDGNNTKVVKVERSILPAFQPRSDMAYGYKDNEFTITLKSKVIMIDLFSFLDLIHKKHLRNNIDGILDLDLDYTAEEWLHMWKLLNQNLKE